MRISKTLHYISSLAFCALFLLACKEDIDTSDRFTLRNETIASYLSKHQQFSEYCKLLNQVRISKKSKSTVMQLLSARGHYTVFAPTNEAIRSYLDSLAHRGVISEASWDAFATTRQADSIRQTIVYNSIIDPGGFDSNGNGILYYTGSFPSAENEELASPVLSDRKLTIRRGQMGPDSIWVNKTAPMSMRNRDIPAINGVIHQMDGVVALGNDALTDLLRSFLDEKRGSFQVAAKLVLACGLNDTLGKIRDERYEELYETGRLIDLSAHPTEGSVGYLPEHRKYGFTLFAETDDFWRQAIGKDPTDISIEDVKQYLIGQGVYPNATTDNKYSDPKNIVYQFITYHLLPCRIPVDKLVVHYNEQGYNPKTNTLGVPMYELYTSMGERRLLKIYESRESGGVYLNRFPNLDSGRKGTYGELSCDPDKTGIFVDRDKASLEAVNAIIYPINQLLWYSEETRDNLHRQRLRWDVSSMFPEFMNNDIRGQTITTARNMTVGIPSDNEYKYFQDMDILEGTKFYYLLGRDKGWPNYLGDEFNVIGRYEIILRLPPVPRKGTYELRIGTSVGVPYRSIAQVYWGSNKNALPAIGIPLDFRMNGLYVMTDGGNTPSPVGWEEDTKDDDQNAEVDKKMRNNGFMKGLKIYCAGSPLTPRSGRDLYYEIRRIMLTETMDPDVVYYLKLKNVIDSDKKQLFLDYIELCPKEVYNNPMTPEDIW